ncbi:MAG: plasmid partitioning protein RepB C-terminal domain-containing protein [Armatimonadota bacterium]
MINDIVGSSIRLGFEMQTINIQLEDILPSHMMDEKMKSSKKYETVMASIQEVGIIEPPVVHHLRGELDKQYLLLDGHMRIEILKELGLKTVLCLVATDDETYTYNNKVNQVTPIQEHFMILAAIKRGVSEERIASALRVDVLRIRQKRNLLQGICTEAIDILKDAPIGAATVRKLRNVKPTRQIEIAEMMNMVNNYNNMYCEALIAATPKDQITNNIHTKKNMKINMEDIARMEREMESLKHEMQAHEDTYGQNFLNLVVVRGYLSKLLDNGRVVRYLSNNHSDLLNTFQQVVEWTSLEG